MTAPIPECASAQVPERLARALDLVASKRSPFFGHFALLEIVRWRAPGGAAVPMTVVGDEGERAVAQTLAGLGFELVYQSRASRGAFDLLAIRAGVMLGVQMKRSALPLHFVAAAWLRMEAEAKRLGWLWVVAAAGSDGRVTFLDPAKGRRRKGVALSKLAAIENLPAWLDHASRPRRRRPKPRGS